MITINKEEEQPLINEETVNNSFKNHPRLRRFRRCLNTNFNCESNAIENVIVLFICLLTFVSTVVIIVRCFLTI